MALGCLELLKKLKPNPCGLPDFVMNRDVVDLPELLEDRVGSALRYACGYWAMHVRSSPTTNDYAVRLVASAIEFFKNNAVPWIEVMSLENRLESVVHSIHNLFDWIGMVCTQSWSIRKPDPFILQNRLTPLPTICTAWQETASDLRCISSTSFSNLHRTYIIPPYPFRPSHRMFRPMILQEKTLVTEFYGRPDTWGAVVRTIKGSSGISHA
jgi:hypothetical protein